MRGVFRIVPLFLNLRTIRRPFGVLIFTSIAFSLSCRALSNSTARFVSLSDIMGDQSSKMMETGDVLKEKPKPQVQFSEEELRKRLTEEEFNVTQNGATERAWTGKYVKVDDKGTFTCVVCGTELFKTEDKYESNSGWPSFSEVVKKGTVTKVLDETMGMSRIEVVCTKCGAHLGHVFNDGPKPSGMRYCINSASLKFDSDKDKEEG